MVDVVVLSSLSFHSESKPAFYHRFFLHDMFLVNCTLTEAVILNSALRCVRMLLHAASFELVNSFFAMFCFGRVSSIWSLSSREPLCVAYNSLLCASALVPHNDWRPMFHSLMK